MRFMPGTAMAGFASRVPEALGKRDDLHACVLLWQRGEAACCLAVLDLVNLGEPWLARLVARATRHLSGCEVMVSCTHTHSGPVVDEATWPVVEAAFEAALLAAIEAGEPGEIGFGTAKHQGFLGYNRRALRSGFEPVDREVAWIVLRSQAGELRGLLLHYACHAAVFGPENRYFSADWPGFACDRLRETLGADVPVAFLQGTSGDINTGYAPELSALGEPIGNRNEATARFVGHTLADTVVAALPMQQYGPVSLPEVRKTHVEFLWNRSPTAAEAQAAIACAEAMLATATPPTLREALRSEAYFARLTHERRGRWNLPGAAESLRVPMSLWKLGDSAALVPFPGEFFVEAGLALKRGSGLPHLFPLGLADGSLSYIPPAAAFVEGGYEVCASRFAPGSSERWVEAALALLLPHS